MSTARSSAMSPSIVTLCVLLILGVTLSGCASTTAPLAYPAQCPKPEQPDDRLRTEPCQFTPIHAGMTRVETEAATITNNQCARQVRDTLVELQRWLRGRVE